MWFPKLYPITDAQLSNYTHPEIVALLLKNGAKIIQLRDKDLSAKDILEATRECLKLTRPVRVPLIVNDRVDVALAADADGVHLGQEDLSVEAARAVLGNKKIIGLSTHSIAQVEQAVKTSANYVAVGPVYTTKTKVNPDPVVGLELVRQARQITSLPLIAIGGITPERAPEVIAAGADSVAVISALYPMPETPSLTEDFVQAISARPDIEGQMRKFMENLS